MYIIGNEEVEAVRRVIESQQLFRYRGGEGGETDQFEQAWAARLGVKHCLAVTSGTAALICGLVGMGIGPGDEVIVPAFTFMATALAPLAVGAIPIIADIDDSLTLDPIDVARKITPRTKAIIPVHMNGLPCNMDAIMAIATQHKLFVLEDACQAVGGSYKGQLLGSIGNAGTFSFNQWKIITCGEGGALVTNNDTIYEGGLILSDGGAAFRDYIAGMDKPIFAGWNFRTNEILSAILRVQVGRLDGILAGLRAEKRLLMSALADETAFCINPIHDPAGDCATTLALHFDSETRMRAFLAQVDEASSPIDSGMHVYANWDPILAQRGAHHPGRDAFKLTDTPVIYSQDMCAQTLSILATTAFIPTSPNRAPTELEELIEKIKAAARQI